MPATEMPLRNRVMQKEMYSGQKQVAKDVAKRRIEEPKMIGTRPNLEEEEEMAEEEEEEKEEEEEEEKEDTLTRGRGGGR